MLSAPRSSSLLALALALLLLASSPYPLDAYGSAPQAGGKYGGRRSLAGYLRESPPPPAPAGGPPIGPLPNIPAPPPSPGP
ncbi:hypothetical protein GQ55_5G493300 [Panicum hallii var. hallii]|uniref:Uncharacterized protein n=2 Tax=Panicum hallii TaxID=206008 RepID=A0A2T7DRN4_9POAL|nr:hypothetical protein GQ55_5G493300 [Panicum hallii var. hallii]PVH39381.1 hypothetical protein PAHAL_5G488300 [Panicum hallii]